VVQKLRDFHFKMIFLNSSAQEMRWNLRFFLGIINILPLTVYLKYLILLSSLSFVQPKHTNYHKIVKELKTFKIIIVAPTCFG